MASRSADPDTLTRAEEEALARARKAVESGGGKRSGNGSRRSSSAPARKRSGGRKPSQVERLASVDVLRGLAVVVSAVVLAAVAPATVPPWARPSAWHGYALADLVLPAFLLTAGVSLALAEVRHGTLAPWRRGLRVIRRVAVLLALGLGLSWLADPDLETLRWTGLLQRMAAATLLAWLVSLASRRVQIVTIVTVVAGWWFALERVSVPGLGRPAVAPDANLARWVDLEVLGAAHTTGPTDPLGLLTTLPAAVVVLAGVLTGRWLRDRPLGPATAAALALSGAWLSVVAIAAAQVTPLNATLWSPPFVLFATGAALAALAVTYLAVEVLPGQLALGPLQSLGRNALVAYAVVAAPVAFLSRPGTGGTSAWNRAVDGFFGPLFGEWSGVVIGLGLVACALWLTRRLDRLGWTLRA